MIIVTQVLDVNHSVLGFFNRWIEALSEKYSKIIVICLYKGEYNLPKNVSVLSLGKETGSSKIKYLYRFFTYLWKYRKQYENVFVHMNQEYILLGGIIWKMLGKRIYLWRNHYSGSVLTDIASIFCNNIFCTSEHSYTAKYKKTVIMPVGIDTNIFSRDDNVSRDKNSILFLARMSSSKRPDVLISALIKLYKEGVPFTASFYGDMSEDEKEFYESLSESVRNSDIRDIVKFYKGVPNKDTPQIYNKHEIFVNLSKSGMYDKTIFEAIGCGCITLASSSDYRKVADKKLVFDGTEADLMLKLRELLNLSKEEKQKLVKVEEGVLKPHTLNNLVSSISELVSE